MLEFLTKKMEMLKIIKLPIVRMRMFDIHATRTFGHLAQTHFNIALTFEIEPKQVNV